MKKKNFILRSAVLLCNQLFLLIYMSISIRRGNSYRGGFYRRTRRAGIKVNSSAYPSSAPVKRVLKRRYKSEFIGGFIGFVFFDMESKGAMSSARMPGPVRASR